MTDSDDSNYGSQNDSRPMAMSPDFAKSQKSLDSASSKSGFTSSAIVQTLRKRHIGIPLVGLILLSVIAFMTLSQNTTHLPNASSEPDPLAHDRPELVDFSVQSVDGKTFKLSEHKGKVILVSFWATECSTCVLEFPAFAELTKRYKKEGFEVVSINLDAGEQGAKSAKDVWERGKFDFDAFVDPTQAVAKVFAIETVPSGFVIDRNGRMAFNSYGANDWLAPETARLIEDLLLEQ